MPYSPAKGIAWPSTAVFDVILTLPSALNKASLLANTFNTLSSQNAIKSVSLVCSFCILPYSGFNSFVIGSAIINWFNLLTPFLLLYIPENINPVSSLSS